MPEDFSLRDDPRGGGGGRDGWCPSCLRRLRQATPPTTALRAPTRPAPGRLPIALLRLPAPPPGGRLPTAVAAVPRLRHQGREGLAAAFQQTLPRPRPRPPTWRLRRMGIWSIVGRAHRRRLSSSAGQVSEESFTLSSEANARLLRPRLPPYLVTLLKGFINSLPPSVDPATSALPTAGCGPAGRRPDGPVSNRRQQQQYAAK